MTILNNKIDFMVVFTVERCNPNGDPLDSNRPRTTFDGYGEVSDVALKRKIRNRMQDLGQEILILPTERVDDGVYSAREKIIKSGLMPNKKLTFAEIYNVIKNVCEKWADVRFFGQVFGFKVPNAPVSFGVRGPVSIQSAISIDQVATTQIEITKSMNLEDVGGKRDSTTFGSKWIVEYGCYVTKGSITTQLAEKTGFSEEDAELLKECLKTLFVNDASSARPSGSMEVAELFWWTHDSSVGFHSSAKIHHSVEIIPSEEYPYYKLGEIKEYNHVALERYTML